jgi:hypothetical protein
VLVVVLLDGDGGVAGAADGDLVGGVVAVMKFARTTSLY